MVSEQYKADIRAFMERNGRPLDFEVKKYGGYTYRRVSTYGWTNHDADAHVHSWDGKLACSWVVPEGVTLTEETYSQFTDTFSPNQDEVGIEVTPCHCACGKYTDVTLRYSGSLGDVLRELFGPDSKKPSFTL